MILDDARQYQLFIAGSGDFNSLLGHPCHGECARKKAGCRPGLAENQTAGYQCRDGWF
jgi:hypothetical protein